MEKILNRWKGKKILIIGDIMLDVYIRGDVGRISPEAPVPVFVLKDESSRLGGAGNVANNIKSLGAIPILVGIIGNDIEGKRLLNLLKKNGIKTEGILKYGLNPTISKTRIIAHNQQILRIDKEEDGFIDNDLEKKVLERIFGLMEEADAIIFEDYDKGTITPNIIKAVVRKAKNKIITADPKYRNFFQYKNISLFKPNLKEIETSIGKTLSQKRDIIKAGKTIRKRLHSPVLITMGSMGMMLFDNGFQEIIPAYSKEVFDVTGAGDTVIASATLALASDADLVQSAKIASIAAGIEVGKFGASTVSISEIKEASEAVNEI